MTLQETLDHISERGILIDRQKLKNLIDSVETSMATDLHYLHSIQRQFSSIQGSKPIDPNSPAKVAAFLFTELSTPVGFSKTTGTGKLSASVEVLQAITECPNRNAPYVKAARAILAIRQNQRALSNLKGLTKVLDPNNRIHPRYLDNCSSGRLYAESPAVQTIGPVERSTLVPEPGHIFHEIDYSSQELYIVAVLSGDKALLDDCLTGDPHSAVQSKLNCSRGLAKAFNYGVLYGMEARGIAAAHHISLDAARSMLAAYFRCYPVMAHWRTLRHEDIKIDGFSRTALSKRPISCDVSDPQSLRRAFNHIVQGTAADMLRYITPLVYQHLESTGAHLVILSHDALLISAPADYDLAPVISIMKSVPGFESIGVKIKTGTDWCRTQGRDPIIHQGSEVN